ncbi:MAG: hypothetical protein IKW60_00165 [Clostridia bacterium]|nr:hypothetical protein [Clostridia bacterium]
MLKLILNSLTKQDLEHEGKKVPVWLIGGILVAILFLAGSSLWEGTPKEKQASQKAVTYDDAYVKNLEMRLTNTLKSMDGVGEVKVFITMESGGEKVVATDTQIRTESSEGENKEERDTTVVFGKGTGGQNPYIVEEKMPQPAGVLVIAKGAASGRVKNEIYEAVKALFGLSPHRIKVSY